MSSYRKGRRFEYKVRDHFQKSGFFVARQARSSFPDLICLKDGAIVLVECKVDGYLSPDDRNRLCKLAKKTKGVPMLAWREGRKIQLKVIHSEEEDSK